MSKATRRGLLGAALSAPLLARHGWAQAKWPNGPLRWVVAYAAGLLHSERVNHEGLGVPPDAFDGFYPVLHEVFRGLAAACWTAEMEAAWLALLAEARAG